MGCGTCSDRQSSQKEYIYVWPRHCAAGCGTILDTGPSRVLVRFVLKPIGTQERMAENSFGTPFFIPATD